VVIVTTVFHQWMGGFPQDEAKAFGVISWGSATAALSKATKVIVKTPHEAAGVPDHGSQRARPALHQAGHQHACATRPAPPPTWSRRRRSSGVRPAHLLDKCFELGNGDIAVGAVRAVQAGVFDIPFAPSRYNAGKMLPARDNTGAIRILEPGNMPLPKEHAATLTSAKIEERAKVEKRKASFQMVIDDIYAISKGRLVGRPQGTALKHLLFESALRVFAETGAPETRPPTIFVLQKGNRHENHRCRLLRRPYRLSILTTSAPSRRARITTALPMSALPSPRASPLCVRQASPSP
jgi:hypothetical protein